MNIFKMMFSVLCPTNDFLNSPKWIYLILLYSCYNFSLYYKPFNLCSVSAVCKTIKKKLTCSPVCELQHNISLPSCKCCLRCMLLCSGTATFAFVFLLVRALWAKLPVFRLHYPAVWDSGFLCVIGEVEILLNFYSCSCHSPVYWGCMFYLSSLT